MAFDMEKHALDPVTGLQIDKETGHLVGIEPKPVKAADPAEYPKYVEVHPSHVVKLEGGEVVTPEFSEMFRDRTGKISVMVHSAEEEIKATGAAVGDAIDRLAKSVMPKAK